MKDPRGIVEESIKYERARNLRKSSLQLQRSPRRLYLLLRSGIYSGNIHTSDLLNEDEIMRNYHTSRNAVREALILLAAEGLVTRTQGTGTVVVSDLTAMTLEGFSSPRRSSDPEGSRDSGEARPRATIIERTLIPNVHLLRRQLGTGSPHVLMTEYTVWFRGRVQGVYTSYTSEGVDPVLRDFHRPGWTLADAFKSSFGASLAKVETTVQAVPCEARTARMLQIRDGAPVLLRTRLLSDATGTQREFSFTYFIDHNVVLRAESELGDQTSVP